MEIEAPRRQPVRTIHEGTVAFADQFEGYGNLVIVDHGSRAYSLYGYLGSVGATRGQRLDAQAVVGTVGATPAATLRCTSSYASTGPPSILYNG